MCVCSFQNWFQFPVKLLWEKYCTPFHFWGTDETVGGLTHLLRSSVQFVIIRIQALVGFLCSLFAKLISTSILEMTNGVRVGISLWSAMPLYVFSCSLLQSPFLFLFFLVFGNHWFIKTFQTAFGSLLKISICVTVNTSSSRQIQLKHKTFRFVHFFSPFCCAS